MKRITKIICLVAALCCMEINCFAEKTVKNLIPMDELTNTKDIEKGDTFFANKNENPKKIYKASAFDAAKTFLYLDEIFNFSEFMNDDQKIAFVNALFSDLEDLQKAGDKIRYIRVGHYFDDQVPDLKKDGNDDNAEKINRTLNITVYKKELKKGVVPGAKYCYCISANSKVLQNSQTGEIKVVYNGVLNYPGYTYTFLAIPLKNGSFVLGHNLNKGKYKYDENMSLIDKGNLMDILLKDEDDSNDEMIEVLYNDILNSDDNSVPAIKIVLAPLNYGLYLLKQGKIDEAEQIWNSIDINKMPSKTPEQKQTIKSFKTSVTKDIHNLLLITRNFN